MLNFKWIKISHAPRGAFWGQQVKSPEGECTWFIQPVYKASIVECREGCCKDMFVFFCVFQQPETLTYVTRMLPFL